MKVFISRDLSEDSFFFEYLHSAGFIVEGRSLVRFKPLSFIFDENTEWLFFYSKTGVEFFFRQIEADLIQNIKLAAIGVSTAATVEKITQRKVDFTGDGHPVSTAEKFLNTAAKSHVTFVRAENSKQSIQKLLEDKIRISELIVYQNTMDDNILPSKADILVFTSPLNVQAYFRFYKTDSRQKIISIGETTTSALKVYQVENVYTVDSPSEKKLVEMVLFLTL